MPRFFFISGVVAVAAVADTLVGVCGVIKVAGLVVVGVFGVAGVFSVNIAVWPAGPAENVVKVAGPAGNVNEVVRTAGDVRESGALGLLNLSLACVSVFMPWLLAAVLASWSCNFNSSACSIVRTASSHHRLVMSLSPRSDRSPVEIHGWCSSKFG